MFFLQLYIVLEGIVVVFGAIRSVIISYAGITALAVVGLRAASLTLALGLLLGGALKFIFLGRKDFGPSVC